VVAETSLFAFKQKLYRVNRRGELHLNEASKCWWAQNWYGSSPPDNFRYGRPSFK